MATHRRKVNSLEQPVQLLHREAAASLDGLAAVPKHPFNESDEDVCQFWGETPKGADGDSLHAVLCAAGYNIRWLLRIIVKKGLGLS
ncbi:MAG: hypothetical protein HQ445_11845 [Polaromonas sp.]|nr:hypothetical protein [Polaromonas sp.]